MDKRHEYHGRLTESGERKEVTHWHNVVLWGKRAERLSKILRKGSRIYVEGRIENRSYDDKDGVKRNISEVNVQRLILLGDARPAGDRPQGGAGQGFGGSSRTAKPGGDPNEPAPEDFGGADPGGDDDIPF